MKKSALFRVRGVLEARKQADAAAAARAAAALEAIDQSIAALDASLESAPAPEDMAGLQADATWRAGAARRRAAMVEARREREAALNAARDTLARSHGEAAALERLTTPPKASVASAALEAQRRGRG